MQNTGKRQVKREVKEFVIIIFFFSGVAVACGEQGLQREEKRRIFASGERGLFACLFVCLFGKRFMPPYVTHLQKQTQILKMQEMYKRRRVIDGASGALIHALFSIIIIVSITANIFHIPYSI